jgi:orotate phosphoribosyltransferase
MTPNQIAFEFRSAFEDTQGWMIGHTTFKNGWHGDGWLEKGALVRDPARLYTLLKHQANAIKKHFPQTELIVGIPACGAVVASFVAAHLELPLALTVTVQDNLEFHRMHLPKPGLKAVLVDDLIFSGSDARAHLNFLSQHGLEMLGISAWVSRVGTELDGVPLATLMPVPFQTFPASSCPLCLQAEAIRWRDVRE